MKFDRAAVLNDYRIACESRQASLAGRREVLTGKAKFGIFGDGKEVAQLAMTKAFQNGDWRSGYYRDQTFMMAAGLLSLEEFFAQLYGDTDPKANPENGGRMMNNHFSTRNVDEEGKWKNLMEQKNSSPDLSPTASQMPRSLGLALASKIFKENPVLNKLTNFSIKGNEVTFGTIGDASTSEGPFWETMNAAGVLQVPLAVSVWDDGWGISVPIEYQTVKQSISEALKGFEQTKDSPGILIFKAKGWDYPSLCEMYEKGIKLCREKHVPVLFHITEVTQPQGHSTSGSHERYKTPEQLKQEKERDCILKMREWIISSGHATPDEVNKIEEDAVKRVKEAKKSAWAHFQEPIKRKRKELNELSDIHSCACDKIGKIDEILAELNRINAPVYKDVMSSAKKILRLICNNCVSEKPLKAALTSWLSNEYAEQQQRYSSHLYSETPNRSLCIKGVPPVYDDNSPSVPGREILKTNWDYIFSQDPRVLMFGEDVGKIGGVNQTLEGLQEKYGEVRIFDTGIRETTIIGQGIGLAMRGLKPIAEIQYFDYLLCGLQILADDLATLQWRTNGGQKAPLIISTRGHRLEGIWHSGSPLSMVINSIRGVNVLVPRDMTRAAGFYNTMLASDDPALIIEPLNGYRLHEPMPSNIGKFRIPVGVPEVLVPGSDVTLVTYGACVAIAKDAVQQLNDFGISVELIDIQSLIPFDLHHVILESLKKTNRVVFFDEDVPGGATAYMMHKVIEEQGGYKYLDSQPVTVTAKSHRPAYSTDGDYFSNPNAENVFEAIYDIMHEANPKQFPKIY